MKKTFLTLSTIFILSSCATNDIISEQDEYSSPSNQLKNELSKNSLNPITNKFVTVMDLTIPSGVQSEHGGCSFTDGNADGTWTSTAAYGPNPLYFSGYMLRGYGKPKRNTHWNGIRFQAGNRPISVISGGNPIVVNDPFENALSIEFPFQANVTYEITLDTTIEDFIYKEQHDQYDQNDDYHGLQQSQAFPTVIVELSNSPEIAGNNPCGGRPVVSSFTAEPNYYKKQKAIITVPPSYEQKTFTFNFSTLDIKSSFIIYFLPERSSSENPNFIPESSFNMYLKHITIIEKPFDPTYVITPPALDPTRNPPCSRCPK